MSMNVVKTLAALIVCTAAAPAVQAAEEVTLSITGSVIPGACSVSLQNPNVDFGTIRAEELSETGMTEFGPVTISYTTTCPSARAVGVSWMDNKAGTAYTDAAEHFGLGEHNGRKIGYYFMVHHGKSDDSDGTLGDLLNSEDNGTTWTTAPQWMAKANGQNMMTYAQDGTTLPAAHERHTGRFYLTAFIAPIKDLDLSENIVVEGNATMSLTYL
jgi:type 1 fimbria pilin